MADGSYPKSTGTGSPLPQSATRLNCSWDSPVDSRRCWRGFRGRGSRPPRPASGTIAAGIFDCAGRCRRPTRWSRWSPHLRGNLRRRLAPEHIAEPVLAKVRARVVAISCDDGRRRQSPRGTLDHYSGRVDRICHRCRTEPAHLPLVPRSYSRRIRGGSVRKRDLRTSRRIKCEFLSVGRWRRWASSRLRGRTALVRFRSPIAISMP